MINNIIKKFFYTLINVSNTQSTGHRAQGKEHRAQGTELFR